MVLKPPLTAFAIEGALWPDSPETPAFAGQALFPTTSIGTPKLETGIKARRPLAISVMGALRNDAGLTTQQATFPAPRSAPPAVEAYPTTSLQKSTSASSSGSSQISTVGTPRSSDFPSVPMRSSLEDAIARLRPHKEREYGEEMFSVARKPVPSM